MESEDDQAFVTVLEESLLPLKKRAEDGNWSPNTRVRASIESLGYTLKGVIGEGPYSKVSLAYSKKLQQDVAIKTIHKAKMPIESFLKFVHREIRLMQRLAHENVVSVRFRVRSFNDITDHLVLCEFISNYCLEEKK